MRTILSRGGLFVISGPDKINERHKELLKDEKTEIFMQSVVITEPTLFDLVWSIEQEIFEGSGIGFELAVESIIIHLTASDGQKYDLNIKKSTSSEEYKDQILAQIKI